MGPDLLGLWVTVPQEIVGGIWNVEMLRTQSLQYGMPVFQEMLCYPPWTTWWITLCLHTPLVKCPCLCQVNHTITNPSQSEMMSALVMILQRNRTNRMHVHTYKRRFIVGIMLCGSWGQEVPQSAFCNLETRRTGHVIQPKAKGLRAEGPLVSSPQVQRLENLQIWCLRAGEDGRLSWRGRKNCPSSAFLFYLSP